MGTHPIFESDFDCLTDVTMADFEMQVDAEGQQQQHQATATLDIEAHLTNYKGNILIQRLQYISDNSAYHRVEALRTGLRAAKKTLNTGAYEEFHEQLTTLVGEDNAGPKDDEWIHQTRQSALITGERLDTEIRNFKGNSVKESIKRGLEEMAEHKLQMGDVQSALKHFSKSRDYCLQAQHERSMCLNIIKTSILLRQWDHVVSYVKKGESEKNKEGTDELSRSKFSCAQALADMSAKRYDAAAVKFLQVKFESFDFSVVLSNANVALYGGLCALASLDRSELKSQVLQSANFKQFLELEPQIREIITAYYDFRFLDALKALDLMKPALLLDIFVAGHIDDMYDKIRQKFLQQYMKPFERANLSKMASSFGQSEAELERSVADLIATDAIKARIDHREGVIIATKENKRKEAIKVALETQETFIWKTQSVLLRHALLSNNLVINEHSHSDEQNENMFT